MKWEWNGRRLAPLHTIFRRLLAWPFYQVARCVLTICALAGWGIDEAERVWKDAA